MNYIDVLNPNPHPWNKQKNNKQLLSEMYEAWKVVTILPDKSFTQFTAIVNTCYYDARKVLDAKAESELPHTARVSTGSVRVEVERKKYESAAITEYQDAIEILITGHHTLK